MNSRGARKFFCSIEIPATNLEAGKRAPLPSENYPAEIIEWLSFNLWISRSGKSYFYKVLPHHWDEESKNAAINDLEGGSKSFPTRSAALRAGIEEASYLVGNEAWEFARNPPINSVFYEGER